MIRCRQTPLWGKKILASAIICAGLMLVPASSPAETPADPGSPALAALLAEQNSTLSRELRRIQREIAALRADLDKPGLQEIFAGIGYIFGLFGTAAFVASRRRDPKPKE
ncbi:hypothetical protein [Desulfococcus sp.]|uniref:hypothetical protein n=1 Tax=Desulfococcus sp. TaxID=2025834 RepID=UPI003593CFC5